MKRRNFFEVLAALAAGTMLPKVGLSEYPKKELIRLDEPTKLAGSEPVFIKPEPIADSQFVLSYEGIVAAIATDITISSSNEMIEVTTLFDYQEWDGTGDWRKYVPSRTEHIIELTSHEYNSSLMDSALREGLMLDILFKTKEYKIQGKAFIDNLVWVDDFLSTNHIECRLISIGGLITEFYT